MTWRERVESFVGGLLEPVDRLMTRVGRGASALFAPVGHVIARAVEPCDALLGAGGRRIRALVDRVERGIETAVAALPLPPAISGWLVTRSDAPLDTPTLQSRMRARYQSMLGLSVIVSVGIHAGAFAFWPTMNVEELSFDADELKTVQIPPEVEIPPPPARIARPATPVVASAAVDEDITIAPTTFEQNRVEDLPPLPDVATSAAPVEAGPTFTPYTVAPRILNSDAVVRFMDAAYPSALRNSGIGGQVVVWLYIDQAGAVINTRLFQPSGFDDLDEAALGVAERIEFSPALNRDRPVAVWIQIPLDFRVR